MGRYTYSLFNADCPAETLRYMMRQVYSDGIQTVQLQYSSMLVRSIEVQAIVSWVFMRSIRVKTWEVRLKFVLSQRLPIKRCDEHYPRLHVPRRTNRSPQTHRIPRDRPLPHRRQESHFNRLRLILGGSGIASRPPSRCRAPSSLRDMCGLLLGMRMRARRLSF